MIKIFIFLEEEDGIDFRAYSLQISNKSEDLPPNVTLQLIKTNEAPGADNAVTSSSSPNGVEGNCRFPMPQLRRALEARQIFMN
jgi:hypothetical protein